MSRPEPLRTLPEQGALWLQGLLGTTLGEPIVYRIDVSWLLGVGLLLAVLVCCRQGKRYGITPDNVYDMMIWQIPLCIIGARLYYVIFYLDRYRRADGTLDYAAMLRIWDGGVAIYGAVITAFIVLILFCKRKKIVPWAFSDLGVMGLLLSLIHI